MEASGLNSSSSSLLGAGPTKTGLLFGAKMLLLSAIAIAPYLGILHAPFVFDDGTSIQRNLGVETGQFWHYPVRLVTFASYELNFKLSQRNPFSYHVLSIGLHGINVALLYLISGSFVGTLLFAVHPLQTESVTYISQRSELLIALFTFIGVLIWKSRLRNAMAMPLLGLCFIAGMESKESFIVFPILLALVQSERSKRLLLWFIPVLGLGAVFTFTHSATGFLTNIGASWNYLKLETVVWFRYLFLIAFPIHQNIDPDVRYTLVRSLLGIISVSTILVAILTKKYRTPALWFLVCMIPTSTLIPIADPMAEHRLYLSLAALAFVLPTLADRRVFYLILPALFVLTVSRNEVWKDPVSLWHDSAMQSQKGRPWFNWASAVRASGDDNMAMSIYGHLLDGDFPQNVKLGASINIAAIQMHHGLFEPARQRLERILVAQGGHPQEEALPAFNDLAYIYAQTGNPKDALDLLQTLVFYDKTWILNASANFNRGLAFTALHDCEDARVSFAVAARLQGVRLGQLPEVPPCFQLGDN